MKNNSTAQQGANKQNTSKFSVKLEIYISSTRNNRKSLADRLTNPAKKCKPINYENGNNSKDRNCGKQKHAASHTITFWEWNHFDLISIKMKATTAKSTTRRPTERNKWQLLGQTAANTWTCGRKPMILNGARCQNSFRAEYFLSLSMLIKCQIAGISAWPPYMCHAYAVTALASWHLNNWVWVRVWV